MGYSQTDKIAIKSLRNKAVNDIKKHRNDPRTLALKDQVKGYSRIQRLSFIKKALQRIPRGKSNATHLQMLIQLGFTKTEITHVMNVGAKYGTLKFDSMGFKK